MIQRFPGSFQAEPRLAGAPGSQQSNQAHIRVVEQFPKRSNLRSPADEWGRLCGQIMTRLSSFQGAGRVGIGFILIEEKLNTCRLGQLIGSGIASEISSCEDQPGQSLLVRQARLVSVGQSGGDSSQPVLPPQIVMQAWMVFSHPGGKCKARRGNNRPNAGCFDRHLERIGNIRYGQQREKVHALREGNLRQGLHQIGHFQVALVV